MCVQRLNVVSLCFEIQQCHQHGRPLRTQHFTQGKLLPYKRPAAVAPTDTLKDRQNKTLGGNRSAQEHEMDEMKPLCQSQKGYKVTIVTNSIKLQVD